MNRRIYRVILVVTTLTLVGFGLPLALVIRQVSHDQLIVRLENEATRAAIEVPSMTPLNDRSVDLPVVAANHTLGIYDRTRLRAGEGPAAPDALVRGALRGEPTQGNADGELIVAIPVISNEKVTAVIRVAAPTSQLTEDVLRSWLLMAALALLILVVAAAAARFEARRLSKPVERLAVAVTRLGGGDFSVRTDRSGVPELDEAARAVDATAARLGQLIGRERSFSANASHQLRTPLTGIRLQLENVLGEPDVPHRAQIMDALGAVDRLETTIEDLLALTRQAAPARESVDLGALVNHQRAVWQLLAKSPERDLVISIEEGLPDLEVSDAAVRQILEVLVSNAFIHGLGVVSVSVSRRAGGIAIEVSDEGPGIDESSREVFQHRHDDETETVSHGLGLPLALNLAESIGGRLFLRNRGPHPCFTLFLLAPDES